MKKRIVRRVGYLQELKHVENWNKYIWKKEVCVELVIYKNWNM